MQKEYFINEILSIIFLNSSTGSGMYHLTNDQIKTVAEKIYLLTFKQQENV